MRSILCSAVLLLIFCNGVVAQDFVGFPGSDFGKVVLSQRQLGGSLESSIGNYNNEPIANYGRRSLFARLGRPIGRLDILTDAGVFPCTAFLISEKHILTNHHCVPGVVNNERTNATQIQAVQLLLGYVRDGIEKGAKRFSVSPTPIESNRELDYAILEVFGNPMARFGRLALSSVEPEDNSPYWIIGHPMGEAQRISREKCQSDSPAVAARRLRHRCDTLPGNSGSPVIDPGLRAAVALHHAGSSRKSINYAVPIALIARQSQIIAKLANATRTNNATARHRPRPPEGQSSSSAGAWQGAWCLLKTQRSQRRCIDVVVDIESWQVSGQLGVAGQPGYAQLSGTVDQAGSLKMNVSGISKTGVRRGRPYSGRLTGRIAGNQLRGTGALTEGRQMTLQLNRAEQGPDKRGLSSASVATASHDVSRQRGEHPYDGLWRVTVDNASRCRKQSWSFPVQVVNGKVYGGARMRPGSINRRGSVRIEHTGSRDRSIVYQYSGTISQGGGEITFNVRNRRCRGIAKLVKTGELDVAIQRGTSVSAPPSPNSKATKWKVVRTSETCRKNILAFEISIQGAQVSGRTGAGVKISGRHTTDDQIEFQHANVQSGGPGVRYVGRVVENDLKGTFAAEWGQCKGRFSAVLGQQ